MNATTNAVYVPMFQSNVTNHLSCFSQKLVERFLQGGKGDVELPIAWKRDNDVIYWIVPRKVNLNGRTHQMFDYIVQKFTSKVSANASKEIIVKNKEMTLDLHEIATLFNISMHSTREMVVRTIRSLQNIKIEQLNISVKDRKSKPVDATVWSSVILQSIGTTIDAKSIKNSKVKVILGDKLAEYLPTAPIVPASLALFAVNTAKYPNAYAIGKRLNLLFKMNFYKERKNIVSVVELLSVAPDLPKREDLRLIGGLYQRIIGPFIRDLNALVRYGVIKEWYFIDNITKSRYVGNLSKLSYDKFVAMNVFFDFEKFPMKETNLFEDLDDNDEEIPLVDSAGNKVKLFVKKSI